MELIDIYDEYMNLIEIWVSKDKAHAEWLWHFCSHIWIYTKDGHILFQKRAANKKTRPNLLDISAAGHLSTWESILDGAMREIQEELNIGLKKIENPLKLINIYKKDSWKKIIEWIIDNEFDAIFLLQLEHKNEISCEFLDGEVECIERHHISNLDDEKFQDTSFWFVPKTKMYRDIVFWAIKRALSL